MHADTIEENQRRSRIANNVVSTWAGTPPMTDEAQVRAALEASLSDGPDVGAAVDALLPYVVDACRKEGLLVEPKPFDDVTVSLWLSYVSSDAPTNTMSARSGLGYTKAQASENAGHWNNQAPYERFARVTLTNSHTGNMERGRHTARMRFETIAQLPKEHLAEGQREALRILDENGWEGGFASAWLAAYPPPVKVEPVAKKKGKYDRANFDSFTAWESAVSGSFGGVVRQWPEWAQAVYKAEHGYLP